MSALFGILLAVWNLTQPARIPELEREFTCPVAVPAPYTQDRRAREGTLLVVYKEHYRIGLYQNARLKSIAGEDACFRVAMGATPWKPKTRRDYASTPEGWYHVGDKRDRGQTAFYRGFLIDYPNQDDVDRALAQGVITQATADQLTAQLKAGKVPSQSTAMGGSVLIHGMGSEYPNWTLGCVAVDNRVMDTLFDHVHTGDDILIIPWGNAPHDAVQ